MQAEKLTKRAMWRVVFGSAQIAGASATLYFLITTGPSGWTIGGVAATGIISVCSRVLFGMIWKAEK
jgi:hypothetical protein